jgi:urease accessory protein
LGGLIATMSRFHPVAGMSSVGFFALFHGYAHGREMPVASGAWPFGFGFVAATLLLHTLGLCLGLAVKNQKAARWAGSAIALSSVGLLTNSLP